MEDLKFFDKLMEANFDNNGDGLFYNTYGVSFYLNGVQRRNAVNAPAIDENGNTFSVDEQRIKARSMLTEWAEEYCKNN